MTTLRIALAQLSVGPDPAQNLAAVADATQRAAEQGAQLVICPEATMRAFGYRLDEVAEPLDGPWADAVAGLAAQHQVTIAVGMFTPGESGDSGRTKVRNTLLVTDGTRRSHYDKIHLFDAYGFLESDTVTPGADLLLTDVAGVRVGFSICYDIRFPGLFTQMAQAGAELLVVSASWAAGPGKAEQWELLARARALDTTAFVAACGQAVAPPPAEDAPEPGGAPTGIGHSLLIGPDGEVLTHLGEHADLAVITIDTDTIGTVRDKLPVLASMRDAERRTGLGR